jgi:hypothetical protein
VSERHENERIDRRSYELGADAATETIVRWLRAHDLAELAGAIERGEHLEPAGEGGGGE